MRKRTSTLDTLDPGCISLVLSADLRKGRVGGEGCQLPETGQGVMMLRNVDSWSLTAPIDCVKRALNVLFVTKLEFSILVPFQLCI